MSNSINVRMTAGLHAFMAVILLTVSALIFVSGQSSGDGLSFDGPVDDSVLVTLRTVVPDANAAFEVMSKAGKTTSVLLCVSSPEGVSLIEGMRLPSGGVDSRFLKDVTDDPMGARIKPACQGFVNEQASDASPS